MLFHLSILTYKIPNTSYDIVCEQLTRAGLSNRKLHIYLYILYNFILYLLYKLSKNMLSSVKHTYIHWYTPRKELLCEMWQSQSRVFDLRVLEKQHLVYFTCNLLMQN